MAPSVLPCSAGALHHGMHARVIVATDEVHRRCSSIDFGRFPAPAAPDYAPDVRGEKKEKEINN